ncbi:uncharacterized protein TNCV_2395661 [Trichonephila clavipes]|nr:uncharacterized protein TNCV_2395661 [Trichonephila clavipes]
MQFDTIKVTAVFSSLFEGSQFWNSRDVKLVTDIFFGQGVGSNPGATEDFQCRVTDSYVVCQFVGDQRLHNVKVCRKRCQLKYHHHLIRFTITRFDANGPRVAPESGHNVTVNGDRYRAMITNFFIPELNNDDVQELWFQQDGATCHTARATIDLLKDTFDDRLISRFGRVKWPPRSCDLTPLDYFL